MKGKHRTKLSNSIFIDLGRIKLNLNNVEEDYENHSVEDDLNDVISQDFSETTSGSNSSGSDDSISSNSSSISEWNPVETPDWLYEVDVDTRVRYEDFCKYIDFSVVNSSNFQAGASSSFVSDEEIMVAILTRPATQETSQSDVIVDTDSQAARYGPLPDDIHE